ncbi:MAG TPA: nitroreductase family protein [Chitinophagales bacterium]|nr:nitroreductase family protein [Chitinophagales bacterium]
MMTEAATVFDNIVKQRRSMRVYDANKPFDGEAVHRSLQRAMYAPNSSNMQMWEFYRVTDPEKIKQLAKYAMNQSAARTARELVLFVVPKSKWKQRAKANFEFHHARYGNKPLHELSKREQRKLKYFTRLMPMYYFQDWLGIWGMIRKLIVTISSLWRPVVWQVTKNDLRVVCHKSAALAAQTFMLSMKAEGYDTCPMEGFDSLRVKRYLNFPSSYEINMMISCGPGTAEGIYHDQFRVDEKEIIFTV